MALRSPLAATLFSVDPSSGGRVQGYASRHVEGRPLLLVHSVNAAASAFEVRPLFDHYGPLRPTYTFDLPGFGLSDRSSRVYDPRRMTDALLAVVAQIRAAYPGVALDALAVSLGCEFLARAAAEEPSAFRSIALVSPTGFAGNKPRNGPPGSTFEVPGVHAVLSIPFLSDALFGALTRPRVVRFFLEKTWGRSQIDEELWAYDVATARAPDAKNAPLAFLSGQLFSKDVMRLYESLRMPVWMSHGVRGDFVDYRGADAMKERDNWSFEVFDTGALPYFEVPGDFIAAYDRFLDGIRG